MRKRFRNSLMTQHWFGWTMLDPRQLWHSMETASKTAMSPDSMSSEVASSMKAISQDVLDYAKSSDTFYKLLDSVPWSFNNFEGTCEQARVRQYLYKFLLLNYSDNTNRMGKKMNLLIWLLKVPLHCVETFATEDVCEKLVCLGKACAGMEAWLRPTGGFEQEVTAGMDTFGNIVPCFKPAAFLLVPRRCF